MRATNLAESVRSLFEAYRASDRNLVESMMSEGLTFTSPYDDHIGRAEYFRKCWPYIDRIQDHHFEKIAENGDEAFVTYDCTLKSGEKFRNTERYVFEDGKIKTIEVYFGDPPIGISREDYPDFLEFAVPLWKTVRLSPANAKTED